MEKAYIALTDIIRKATGEHIQEGGELKLPQDIAEQLLAKGAIEEKVKPQPAPDPEPEPKKGKGK